MMDVYGYDPSVLYRCCWLFFAKFPSKPKKACVGDVSASFFPLLERFVVAASQLCRSRKKARERRFELRKLLILRCVTFRLLTFYEAINCHWLMDLLWKRYDE
nr:hypothetical protein [uncultured Desulfobulbus sp.]